MKPTKKRMITLLLASMVLIACQKVPITGRKQMTLIPNSEMNALGFSSYAEFLKENPPMPANSPQSLQVKNVGAKLQNAVVTYLSEHGYSKQIEGYQWEFNAVDSKEANAWCMPGGKVVVYTGLLPITKDDAGLAVVMGHEIAHAIAKHGNERMTQQYAAQGVATAASIGLAMSNQTQMTQDIFNQAFGVGSQLGILKYSRTHELEADKLGIIFMAMAGFDPNRAVSFWQDMAKASEGNQKPPEFMSTHPSDDRRIAEIQKALPEALKYYNPSSAGSNTGTKTGTGSGNQGTTPVIKIKK